MTAPSLPEFVVEVDVTPALIKFNRIAGRFSNFKPLAGGRVDVIVRRMIRRQFDTQGGNRRWPALKPWYAAAKRRAVGNKRILRYSDRLYNALTVKNAEGQVLTLEKDHYNLSVNPELMGRARAHQFGLGYMPVRRFIPDPLPKSFIADLKRAAKAYIVRGEK